MFITAMKSKRGFSLLEVLVVVVILGILTTLAVPIILGRTALARETKDLALAKTLQTALGMYMADRKNDPEKYTEELTLEGYPVSLSVVWSVPHETKYLDSATVAYLKAHFMDNSVKGKILFLEYDNTTGVISTRKE